MLLVDAVVKVIRIVRRRSDKVDILLPFAFCAGTIVPFLDGTILSRSIVVRVVSRMRIAKVDAKPSSWCEVAPFSSGWPMSHDFKLVPSIAGAPTAKHCLGVACLRSWSLGRETNSNGMRFASCMPIKRKTKRGLDCLARVNKNENCIAWTGLTSD